MKAIHYFASHYYDQMGQLYDATKFSRSEEKRRKEEKKALQQAGPSRHVSTSNNSADIGEDDGADNDIEGTRRKRRKGASKHDAQHRMRDMYKAFDGTALIAIGAFLS